ncbi:hypothetical protein [Terriglobus saanensis]|uniref:Uncharacterized protein n=1 Tax=Terriglobus saanensis (strain ATCC BAA-1853 / DSM 23119 / SP1PR4) TaxID=401053 RepID=E8V1T4_TERSS|nr:hypothetical protein [Terriglobus saanensis]ADV83422.1 hypothetical protein AciPR4_2644 [Terriglobus saanensis SP1PR4]
MSVLHENPASLSDTSIPASVEERLAIIERVANSTQFSKSTRLRDFLRFVGKRSVKAGANEIHEHEIGVQVFGRSESYDRGQDNIVRVNATELRKRIDSYFSSEGAHETLIFTIPRGSYIPVYEYRSLAPDIPATGEPPVPLGIDSLLPSASRWKNSQVFWIFLSAGLAAICIFQFVQMRSLNTPTRAWANKPNVVAFWTEFTKPNTLTDIVLPDEAVSMSEEIVGHPITLSDYLDKAYIHEFESSPKMSAERKADLHTIFNHNLVTFGGFHAAQEIIEIGPIARSMHLVHSRFYEAESLKRNNLILIGGKKANPWVHLFDDQVNFSLDYDDAHSQAFVSNHQPKPGEEPIYKVVMDRNALYGYSVISYLPNPSHTGNVLIIAGTDSDATAAAAEFLTSEEGLRKLRTTFGGGEFHYFEVLLKTSRLSGTSFNSQLVAYRTHA